MLQALKEKFMVPMEKLLSREEVKMIYPKIKVSPVAPKAGRSSISIE